MILFSSTFNRPEKDAGFAFRVIDAFSKETTKNVQLIELKGYTRHHLTNLMQAANALILCSEREGSPQVIKEAILNCLPVVSNDVGEVKSICSGIDNCFIISKDVNEYVKYLQFLCKNNVRIPNRGPVIDRFDNNKFPQEYLTYISRF